MSMRGKNIAILESRLGRQLVDLVAQRGGIAFHAPALAELPDLDPGEIGALVRSLGERPARLAVFQTGVGTRALFAATDSLGLTESFLSLLKGMTVVVRGPKPTAALRARGVRIDRSAADPFTTKEVLISLEDLPLQGERVIVQRYGSVNVELDRFSVALIPHTLAHTTLGNLQVGSVVNLETDLLAKYVERQLATTT